MTFAEEMLYYYVMMEKDEPINLILPPTALAVFVDDTGHEELVKGHPVYGLGGCAVMAPDLERIIEAPWKTIRHRVTGSPDTPLHASKFGQTASQDDIHAVADFFHRQPFFRFGAIISTKTKLADEMDSVQTIAQVLQQRIIDIARYTPFQELHVIFESSERADPLIKKAFQEFNLEENSKPIPVECHFMRKSAGNPSLEVADFVMHAVGRQARQQLKEPGKFVPDFKAVFHSVDKRFTSFMYVTGVKIDQENDLK